MATSGITTFSQTRDDIIKRALRLIGVTAQGETPTTDQISEASTALNGLVKAWQADGMPLWAIRELNIDLTSGSSSYGIGIGQANDSPKPLKILQAWNRDLTSSVDIPMRIVSRQEYNLLGNKTSSGNPIQLYYEPLVDYGVIHVFPVPTATEETNNNIYIVYQRPFEDFDAAIDTPDFPQEWYDAVTYGLATRLAPEYGVSIPDRKTLWQEMSIIKQEALNFGLEEASLFFQVDRRNW
jgi:hypothetical protein